MFRDILRHETYEIPSVLGHRAVRNRRLKKNHTYHGDRKQLVENIKVVGNDWLKTVSKHFISVVEQNSFQVANIPKHALGS